MPTIIVLLSIFAASTVYAAIQFEGQPSSNLDPTVTGGVITPEQLTRWHVARAQADACPSCALSQPYPGDRQTQ